MRDLRGRQFGGRTGGRQRLRDTRQAATELLSCIIIYKEKETYQHHERNRIFS
jgi:hypothetical protein